MMVNPIKGTSLFHGGDLLTSTKSDYERKKGSDHSLPLIHQTLKRFKLLTRIFPGLLKQFTFDALIGNGDRHQDNWGIIYQSDPSPDERPSFAIAPAFDNGSSFGREVSEDRASVMVHDSSALDRYIDKGYAHVRIVVDGNLVQVPHEVLLRRSLESFPKFRPIFESVVNFRSDRAEAAIRRIARLSRQCPGVEITEGREDFIVQLLLRRKQRLQSLLESV